MHADGREELVLIGMFTTAEGPARVLIVFHPAGDTAAVKGKDTGTHGHEVHRGTKQIGSKVG